MKYKTVLLMWCNVFDYVPQCIYKSMSTAPDDIKNINQPRQSNP